MSWTACLIDCCEDATRFVKTIIAFVIGSVAVGLAFQAKHDVNIMMRMVTQHTGIVAFLSNIFTCGFCFMYLVNIGCLMYSFMGLPCIRNYIFRERMNETRMCCGFNVPCRAIQLCLGPCCATYHQIMVAITLAVQVGLSYCYLMMGIFLGFLGGMCHGGNGVVSSFQGFLDTFHSRNSFQAGTFSPMNWFMELDVAKYCDAARGLDEAAMQCFSGCALSVVSQVLMMIVISEEKGRIEGTMADASIAIAPSRGTTRKGRRQNVSDSSSSSSDSDHAADPLKQYQANKGSAAGRNYKLPGAYH